MESSVEKVESILWQKVSLDGACSENNDDKGSMCQHKVWLPSDS